MALFSAYPILTSPGYRTRWTLVHVADNPRHLIDAHVESGEGIDRAGGFAIQVRVWSPNADALVIEGFARRQNRWRLRNVIGFPAASFIKLLELLVDEDPDFPEV